MAALKGAEMVESSVGSLERLSVAVMVCCLVDKRGVRRAEQKVAWKVEQTDVTTE